MKESSNMPSHITLEMARTLDEHNANFERYGVLWWWKLLNEPRWTKSSVWETVGAKEIALRLAIHPLPVVFEYRYKRSAFFYEMKARVAGKFEKYEFDKPWSELTQGQWDTLAERWPLDKAGVRAFEMRRPFWSVAPPGTKPNRGWTDFQNVSWNLHYNNEKLVRAFKARLNLDRERLGQQRKVNQGTRHRVLSWRPIELIDQKQFEGKVWTDGDRSQVRKAIKEAIRVFNSMSD